MGGVKHGTRDTSSSKEWYVDPSVRVNDVISHCLALERESASPCSQTALFLAPPDSPSIAYNGNHQSKLS